MGRCGPCCSIDPATSRTVVFPDRMASRISVHVISSIRDGLFLRYGSLGDNRDRQAQGSRQNNYELTTVASHLPL